VATATVANPRISFLMVAILLNAAKDYARKAELSMTMRVPAFLA
jgi:hypothetical protein